MIVLGFLVTILSCKWARILSFHGYSCIKITTSLFSTQSCNSFHSHYMLVKGMATTRHFFLDAFHITITQSTIHDDVIKWKHFPRYWLFERGIHPLPVVSHHKSQWSGVLVFSLICANKRLSKQSRRQWFETQSHLLWRHCNAVTQFVLHKYCHAWFS